MRFKELAIGQQFDFIDDSSLTNSFFYRCVKTGKRTYETVDHITGNIPHKHEVGTINVKVYHYAL
jgi:hypothetical protein